MSGSPPPEQARELPREPPQIAGRRRRRSETPPSTIATGVATPPTPLEQTAPRILAQGRGGQTYGEVAVQSSVYGSTYPTNQQYGPGATLPPGSLPPQTGPFGSVETSPRATRKTKAHVPSACVNCKKKHLRCYSNRPCRRCVQHGKEDTCVDVEHKKRGRPPLKPDDPSTTRRPFESALSPLSGQASEPTRGLLSVEPSAYTHSSTAQRSFRPLQALPPFDPTRPQFRQGPPLPPMYGQPTISASPTTAMGTFIPSPLNYQTSLDLASRLPQSSYLTSVTEAPSRSLQPYGERYSYPPPAMPGQGQMGPPQSLYANPIFPRTTIPPPAQLDPLGLSGPSSLQLPPIRPGPLASPPDSVAIQQQQQYLQQPPPPPSSAQRSPQRPQIPQERTTSSDDSTRPPGPKRPKMDIQGILGPRSD